VRKNLVGDGHLTALVTSNASGGVLKPFFIFPGQNLTDIPAGSLEDEKYVVHSASGYMDEELFLQWICKFIKDVSDVQKIGDSVLPVLLLLDGQRGVKIVS
jgi:hypothetical protein